MHAGGRRRGAPPAAHGPLAFATYRKTWLFPLTERLPPALDSERVRRWLPWLGTWKPGAGPKVVPLALRDGRTLRIAPLICYDAAVPSFALAAIRGGADLIVTLSNDSWFTYGDVPRLILIVSAFRSIETRRPQVRATNTGISAVIAPTGEMLATAGVDERAVDHRPRPVEDRLQPRRQQPLRLGIRGPAVLVVLGPSELRRHRQPHVAARAQRDVIACDLPSRVRLGLAEDVAPAELERFERRLLPHLSQRCLERGLVRLDETLREVPVAEGAQHEVAPVRVARTHDDHAGRPLPRHHPESRSRSVLVRTSWTSRTFGPLNISRGGPGRSAR